MCYCDVQTMPTKPTVYKQCKQNLPCTNKAKKIRQIVPKKALVIKLDPPRSGEIDAPADKPYNFMFYEQVRAKSIRFKTLLPSCLFSSYLAGGSSPGLRTRSILMRIQPINKFGKIMFFKFRLTKNT